jgi:hypothetical protein
MGSTVQSGSHQQLLRAAQPVEMGSRLQSTIRLHNTTLLPEPQALLTSVAVPLLAVSTPMSHNWQAEHSLQACWCLCRGCVGTSTYLAMITAPSSGIAVAVWDGHHITCKSNL